ncbi:MAG: aminotransferase class IV [Flavobacteriaceae bacterium]|jgi:branched-chain amino acid aminotransferase|nr:aminotransferase class IV [Flavobacteriaceae bacterium]
MKIIFNHQAIDEENLLIKYTEHSLFSGDYVQAFCWFFQKKLLFWEDVYFQLMASMRKMRMEIPQNFTPELFEKEIVDLINENLSTQGTVKITVFRKSDSAVDYVSEILPYKNFIELQDNELDIYKEINIFPNLLSGIYIFQPVNLPARKYAQENDLQEVIILNDKKNIARAVSGNIFMIQNNEIRSNPPFDGAFLSSLKKNFITFLREETDYIYREETLSPFQTQSVQEIFILSDEKGVIPVTKIRKTTFSTDRTLFLVKKFIGYAVKKNSDNPNLS